MPSTQVVRTVTVVDKAGVVYKRADTGDVVTTATPITLTAGQLLKIQATPANGYFFGNNVEDEWNYKGKP